MTSNRDQRKARAEARRQRAEARYQAAADDYQAQPAHRIPLGQPILLGHHSQRRHERDLQRLQRAEDKRYEAYVQLQAAEERARNAGSSIQTADDDAVEALTSKLAAAEAEHAAYLAHNTAVRRGACLVDDCPGCRKLRRAGRAAAERLPGYALTNSRARINQIRRQLTDAQAHAAAAADGVEDEVLAEGAGWQLVNGVADGRVRFLFADRPDPDIRAMLKRHGFRWAPSAGAWQRHNTGNGLAVARHLAGQL